MFGQQVTRIAIAAAVLCATSAAVAQPKNDRGTAGLANAPGTPLFPPYAQAAAFVDAGGAVVSSKGFSAITHPSTGQYCLELVGSVQAKTVPHVTVDWSRSLGNILFAYWRSAQAGCPGATPRTINVTTYATSSGTLSDSVAFVVIVP